KFCPSTTLWVMRTILDFVQYYKMAFLPMQNARHRCFMKVFCFYFYSKGIESYLLCTITDGIHAYALIACFAYSAQFVDAVFSSILLGYYPQAGGTAVHKVELLKK